jgi:isoquinoline 1-oxidoreductase beta subunit
MEPLNCTAHVEKDKAQVWVGTQGPTRTHDIAAEITGLPRESITVNVAMLGGGFGRRSQTDFAEDALHASKAVGKPVKVIWSREDDVRGGWYRPMAYNELAGRVEGKTITHWVHRIASPSILAGSGRGPLKDGIDPSSTEGAANLPYAIPNQLVTYADPKIPISTWWWRSVGSSQNAYVTECFFDELAAAAKADPFELRRSLLADSPRHKKVLEVAADKANWGKPLAEGHAHGIAVHMSFGSYCAQVAEVSIDNGQVRVHNVVCAIDPGRALNPDTIEAQIESGIAYGLSAALYGEIRIARGSAVQANFDTYPVVRMREMPSVQTHIVEGGGDLGGIGEPGLPPIAPAVVNALFALTKKPIRKLPIALG